MVPQKCNNPQWHVSPPLTGCAGHKHTACAGSEVSLVSNASCWRRVSLHPSTALMIHMPLRKNIFADAECVSLLVVPLTVTLVAGGRLS